MTQSDVYSNTPLLPSQNIPENSRETLPSTPKSFAQFLSSISYITMATTVISGAAFGAALVASGVYQPSVIISQLELRNWHMLQAFLTATGSSALFVYALEKLGHCHPSPRQATTIGVFSSHDGNIVGGALLGVGMALSGACPGTVLAQVGVGISSGFYALDGALLAGLVWTSLLKPWLQKSCNRPKSISFYSSETPEKKPLPLTIHERINVPRGALLLAFEGLCAAAVGATIYFGPVPNAKISPVLGGLLIGLSQFWSLLTRKTLLGASTAYEEAGALALWLLRNAPSPTSPNTHSSKQPHMGLKNILFATSMAAGAWAIGKLVPSLIEGAAVPLHSAFALSGGFLMVLGARIAGGCTSGHGISGMSIFSVSSFITIGTALVVGTLTRSAVVRAFV